MLCVHIFKQCLSIICCLIIQCHSQLGCQPHKHAFQYPQVTHMGRLKKQDKTVTNNWNCRAGHCRTGQWKTKSQGRSLTDKIARRDIARQDTDRQEKHPTWVEITRRMAIANTCVSCIAYAPGTIAVNVTWIEREFNACQTPPSMYPSIFNHFWDIVVYQWRVSGFQQYSWANERFFNHILLSPGTPLGQSR